MGKHICIQDTGSQGLGRWRMGWVGGRKQTTRGAGNRPDTWSWEGGAKRETRGALESRCQRWGYSGNQGKPGLTEGGEQVWGQ